MATNHKKFSGQAKQLSDALGEVFNRALRASLLDGLATAVEMTKHDSSNAAAHWMLAGSRSRPSARRLGRLKDLRGTLGIRSTARAPVFPVGYRDDGGIHKAETLRFVRERELKEVIDKLVSGRNPEFKFYFYNAAGDEAQYSYNANIQAAGEAAVQATIESAARRIAAGNARKVPLR